MRISSAFNRLLRLPGASVIDVGFSAEGVIVTVKLRRRRRVCGCCGQTARHLEIHDRRVKRWRHLDLGSSRCVIESELRRLRCHDCGVQLEAVPWARQDAHHSRRGRRQARHRRGPQLPVPSGRACHPAHAATHQRDAAASQGASTSRRLRCGSATKACKPRASTNTPTRNSKNKRSHESPHSGPSPADTGHPTRSSRSSRSSAYVQHHSREDLAEQRQRWPRSGSSTYSCDGHITGYVEFHVTGSGEGRRKRTKLLAPHRRPISRRCGTSWRTTSSSCLVDARRVKQVPGRKTARPTRPDLSDPAWFCQLAESGLLRVNFVPPSRSGTWGSLLAIAKPRSPSASESPADCTRR